MFSNFSAQGRNLESACRASKWAEEQRYYNLSGPCRRCGGRKEPFTPFCGPVCQQEDREEREHYAEQE